MGRARARRRGKEERGGKTKVGSLGTRELCRAKRLASAMSTEKIFNCLVAREITGGEADGCNRDPLSALISNTVDV